MLCCGGYSTPQSVLIRLGDTSRASISPRTRSLEKQEGKRAADHRHIKGDGANIVACQAPKYSHRTVSLALTAPTASSGHRGQPSAPRLGQSPASRA